MMGVLSTPSSVDVIHRKNYSSRESTDYFIIIVYRFFKFSTTDSGSNDTLKSKRQE